MSEYSIALDAMGGDQAPDAIVAGAIAALRRFEDIRVLLAGPENGWRHCWRRPRTCVTAPRSCPQTM